MKQLLIALLMMPGLVFAHHPPVVIPPAVSPPPVVTPPAVSPPVVTAPPSTPSAPAQQPVAGDSFNWMGQYGGFLVMAGVAIFFYLAICQVEEERDPELHKTLLCPPTPK